MKVYKASEYFSDVYALLGVPAEDNGSIVAVFDQPLDTCNYKLEFKCEAADTD